jgi:hypothetical protein
MISRDSLGRFSDNDEASAWEHKRTVHNWDGFRSGLESAASEARQRVAEAAEAYREPSSEALKAALREQETKACSYTVGYAAQWTAITKQMARIMRFMDRPRKQPRFGKLWEHPLEPIFQKFWDASQAVPPGLSWKERMEWIATRPDPYDACVAEVKRMAHAGEIERIGRGVPVACVRQLFGLKSASEGTPVERGMLRALRAAGAEWYGTNQRRTWAVRI